MKRKIFSWFKYGAFVLFVVIACTELASQIYVAHYRTDLLRIHESEENTFETKRLKDWKANFKRSPYFGYVTTYGNNYGFSSSENYPITRYENTYVIAVLGGSVADYFVRHVIGHNELTEKLKQLVPSLKDRDIQFMNLAIPGYKQPQQYFAMSYFIEHIDLVIQIDGWNEVWSRTSGAYPMDYPTFSEFLYNDQSLEKIEEMIENKKLAETIRLNPILSKSKTMLLFRNIILKDVYGQAKELTSNQSTFYTFFQDNQTIQGFLINNWKNTLNTSRRF